MDDEVKLIVTLSKGQYENLKNIRCGSIGARMIINAVQNGIPLDDVKAEMLKYSIEHNVYDDNVWTYIDIIDKHIGKTESEE